MGQGLAGGLLVQLFQARQLLLECGLIGDAGHIRVVVGVVAHNVALIRHTADDVRGRLHHVPDHKECRRGVVLFQCVQDLLRITVFIPTVEGEVDHLFPSVAQIVGPVLGQILHRGIADGRGPLRLEGQAPVPGGCGDCGGGRCRAGLPAQRPRRQQQHSQRKARQQGAVLHLMHDSQPP